MADDKKPSLAVIIAQAKGKGKEPVKEEDDYSGDEVSPEAVKCVSKFWEAKDADDAEAGAKALAAFFMHVDSPDEME